jgi:uncharacterized membrane protein YhhN
MKLQTINYIHLSIKLTQYALFFGLIGDILLEIKGSEYYFQIGVVAFFIGHCFYIFGFSKAISIVNK